MCNMYKLTEEPVLLKSGTDGSAGFCGCYVLFGDYPQGIKAGNVAIDETKCFVINGWNCYKGSDGFYYAKVKARGNECGEKRTFSNGEPVVDGNYYFFKLESIKWRILNNNCNDVNNNASLLFCENILTAGCFDTHYIGSFIAGKEIERSVNKKIIHGNNYEYSSVRAFLNGLNGSAYDVEDFTARGFIDLAFSPKAIEKIRTSAVDNGVLSITDSEDNIKTSDAYICNNTSDKIFLLSEREITKKEYGFDSYNKKSLARVRKATDYSIAAGSFSVADGEFRGANEIWLRSPVYDIGSFACAAGSDGNAYDDSTVNETYLGIVPALSVCCLTANNNKGILSASV